MKGFTVAYRNPGHWDIGDYFDRIFRIRGGPGKYIVIDERGKHSKEKKIFRTVQACMSYICDELMFELIVAESQTPKIIENWNI